MYLKPFRAFSSIVGFVTLFILANVISACSTSPNPPVVITPPPTSSIQSLITWPFDANDGQWEILNGYREGDHEGYAEWAMDFVKCLPTSISASDGTCKNPNGSGWDKTHTLGADVLAPVSGTIAWPDDKCFGASIQIDGHPGYRVVLFHIDPLPGTTWSQLAYSKPPKHFNQGDKIGTVSTGFCIPNTTGYHIHMALYHCTTDCTNDTADQRVGDVFSNSWSIANCPYPDDGTTGNKYQGVLVPCHSNATPSPTPPTPILVPTPTQPLILAVNPSSIDASNSNVCPNGKCEMTLSSPNSNTLNIDWKATITIRAGAGTLIIGSVSPSSGTLAPGQVITVSFIISSFICGDITGSTITFTGGVSPVVVQLSGSFGPC